MWIPKRLVMRNLMAFEEVGYDFLEGHAVMIQGRNLSDDGQDSNGSCKSALLEGIGISITGKCIRLDTSAKDLVRNGEVSADVEFYLENPVLGKTLLIRREIFTNTKSATLEIEVDDKPLTQITSVNEGNERIFEILGIERNDFLNYYLISKERYEPFYKLSDKKKKEVISRFSNADMISPIEEELDENIKKVDVIIEDINSEIEKATIKIDTYENDMDSFSVEELKEKRDNKIKTLKESIDTYNNKIKENESDIEGFNNKLGDIELTGQDLVQEFPDDFEERTKALDDQEEELREDMKVYDGDLEKAKSAEDDKKKKALESIDSKEKKFNQEMSDAKGEKSEAEKMLADVEKGLMESIECPKCSHEFSPGDKELNISKAKEKKGEISDIISDIDKEIGEIREDIDSLDKKRSDVRSDYKSKVDELQNQYSDDVKGIRDQLDGVDKNRAKLREDKRFRDKKFQDLEDEQKELEQKISARNRKITSYNEEITSINEEISTVEEQVIKDRKSEFKDKIEEQEKLIKGHEENLELEDKNLQKAKEEKEVFLRFKTHLSNKAIAVIEGHSNNYLEIAKSNIRIQLDGYKQTKAGEIREKITTTVFRDGISEGGVGKFSSGEKVRIEVSNILAMKKMINNASPTGGLDLLVLDEITNSLDSSGIGGVMDMLAETKETTIHITHATFHSMYPHIQTVVKEGNVSTIIEGQYGEE